MFKSVKVNVCFVLLLSFIIPGITGDIRILDVTSSKLQSLGNHTRTKRQNCSDFQCKAGQCIPQDNVCDGVFDCLDGSDETSSTCEKFECPSYLERCKYGGCIKSVENCKDTCAENELRCRDGGCINEDQICDGTPECRDGSDESLEYCSNFYCASYLFQCTYGACIQKSKICDGVKDCNDGSDESSSLCGTVVTMAPPTTTSTTPRITTSKNGQCILPEHPSNGHLSFFNPKLTYIPGTLVDSSTLLKLHCDTDTINHYVPKDEHIKSNIVICDNGTWTNSFECVETCSLQVPRNTQVTCTKDNFKMPCGRATEGVSARFSCDSSYEISGKITTLYCSGHSWDYSIPQCIPKCGKKYYPSTPLIINGTNAKKGDYPWQVALYKEVEKKEPDLICGGTLLRENIVVTAAHCVTNDDGEIVGSPRNYPYLVAAGKYYREYHINETGVQFSKIKKIVTTDVYRGYKYFFAFDIAILVMEKEFKYNSVIKPVCLDFDAKKLKENTLGVVTGWGYTEEGSHRADTLKEIEIPYVDTDKCKSLLPETHTDYLSADKICSGHLNKGIAVCQGDSGGGLVFIDTETNKYYLRGIVSLSPSGTIGSCDKNTYGLFTDVVYHSDFIRKQLAANS